MVGSDPTPAEKARLDVIRGDLLRVAAETAALEARRVRLLAEANDIAQAQIARMTSRSSRDREMPLRSIALELAMPLRMSDRTLQRHLGDAEQLTRLFPATVAALADGRITRQHADAILDAGCVLADADERAGFEQVVLGRAAADSPARTRAFARGLADRLQPRSIDERFADAYRGRAVTVKELDDGMAEVVILTSIARARAIEDRLLQQAKAIEAVDSAARREHEAADDGVLDGDGAVRFDERSRDNIRHDLVVDMLLTGQPAVDPTGAPQHAGGLGAIHAQISIAVPVTTLTGVTAGGAELDGRSPVDSETARRLAGNAPGWDRVMTDPVTATVIAVDRYRPAADQKRFLTARDVHCRCPGCRQPVRRLQLDHNAERQHGGETRITNLAHFCVGQHTVKTETEWTVTQLPGGSLQWTSPLGYAYRDHPPPRLVFLPDPEPDPERPPF